MGKEGEENPTVQSPDGWRTFLDDRAAYFYFDSHDTVLFRCRYCGGTFYELRKEEPKDYEVLPTCPKGACLTLAELVAQHWPWANKEVGIGYAR